MTTVTKLGVSGEKGSFSEAAALAWLKKIDEKNSAQTALTYLLNAEGVLSALAEGTIDAGIFPFFNSLSGLVWPTFEAMGRHSFKPIDQLTLDIHQNLMVKPGVDKVAITQIVSHPQALAQCRDYLAREFAKIQLIKFIDTASAAKALAEGELPPTAAVIGSEHAANLYGLAILAQDIQDGATNTTSFVVVNRGPGRARL